MRPFDYLIVLFSVLLGLSLSRLLAGLARVVVDPARRLHWLPLLWTIQLFLVQVMLWWLIYVRVYQVEWTFAHYLVILAYPVLGFFMAVLLFPELGSEDEGTVESFLDRRRWFFGIWILSLVLDATENAMGGVPEGMGQPAWGLLIGTPLLGAALITRKRWYHALLAILLLAMVLGSVFRMMPEIR